MKHQIVLGRYLFSGYHAGNRSIPPIYVYRSPTLSATAVTYLCAGSAPRERLSAREGNEDTASTKHVGDHVGTIEKFVQILSPAFLGDPLYSWFLSDIPSVKHQTLLPMLFRALMTQASLNNGILLEVGNSAACGLLMPPGSRLENPWTMLRAGLAPALWTLGPGTFKVYL